MAPPSITFTLRTATPAGLLYARLAPSAPAEPALAQVWFVVDVANTGKTPVTLAELRVDFPADPGLGVHTIAISNSDGTPVTIPAGGDALWWNQRGDNLFVTLPAPAEVRLAMTCEGNSEPVRVTLPLVPHAGGPDGQGYRFPGRNGDLRPNEYWRGRGGSHRPAGAGNQLFAYDLGAIGADATGQEWSELLDGMDDTDNAHYRVYGKPVYAMADGVVVSGRTDRPENEPGTPGSGNVEGNHVYIQHGAELAVYSHLQPGSTPAGLLVPGTPVTAGQQLGLVGNTGNSYAPHLHVHVIEGTQPWEGPCRPLQFRAFRAQAASELGDTPDTEGWVAAHNAALPRVRSAIRPPAVGKIGPADPPIGRMRKPIGKLDKKLVAESSPGVSRGAGGHAVLPGGGRKPIDPRGPAQR